MKTKGKVSIVGAGPGDAGLLTVRGAELLSRADVVVHDALVNPDLLRLAPRGAEILYAGKRANQHSMPQEELNRQLVEKAREGRAVVRLKGGDPYIFGRGAEEAEALQAEGIPFEVVPGVSSISAVPNYAGIPLTHREHCSSFTVFTGHEDPAKGPSALDYAHLARLEGTKVVLMGVDRIRSITQALIDHGMAPSTPVGVVQWGTTGQQRSVHGTLTTIADQVEQAKVTAPAVIVIGSVVTLRSKLDWFGQRPLLGRRVVVTRMRDQASQLAQQLFDLGAEVLEVPTIKIADPDDKMPMLEALQGLGEYDWLIFTSSNGVTSFFHYFFKAFEDVRALGNLRIAAVGPTTAARLQELHLKVDVMPEQYLASKVTGAIAHYESVENLRFLLARAQVANPELCKALEEQGGIVDDIAFYKTVPETEDRNGAAAVLTESGADWITFTSGSTVENFHARFDLPRLVKQFPRMRLASIGPETSKALAAHGLKPAVEARPHTIDGLVKALRTAEKNG